MGGVVGGTGRKSPGKKLKHLNISNKHGHEMISMKIDW
jgi:hypothetical protein